MKPHQFERVLAGFKGWREMAFCVALAERGWPNYALFCQLAGFPHEKRMRGILDAAWQQLETAQPTDPYVWLVRLEEGIPNPDDHDMFGVSPAVDFCHLLEHAWLSRTENERPRAELCSELSRQTVQTFVELTEGQGMDDDQMVRLLDRSPFMKAELSFQHWLADTLRQQAHPTAQFLAELREDAAGGGVSNLGIDLNDIPQGEEVQ